MLLWLSRQCSQHQPSSTRPLRRHLRHLAHEPNTRASQKHRILFCGRDEFSCLVLSKLHAARNIWSDIYVVTQPDALTGRRGSKMTVSPLKVMAQDLCLDVTEIPHRKKEFRTWKPPPPFFTGLQDPPSSSLMPSNTMPSPNHVLITASFGRILPASVLRLFPEGRRLNVHPSLLPKYRGAAPIQHTIMNSDTSTGVCVIDMLQFSKGIDCGDIWGRETLVVPPDAYFRDLNHTLGEMGGELLARVLEDMLTGKARSAPQVATKKTPIVLAPAISAEDALLKFQRGSLNAERIMALHRAISHQRPITVLTPDSKRLQLHSLSIRDSNISSETRFQDSASTTHGFPASHGVLKPGMAMIDSRTGTLLIFCSSDPSSPVLEVLEVQSEGKKRMKAREWWNGARSLGLVEDGYVQLF